MIISYPNFEGLGDWEPARAIIQGNYGWENVSTNQIDVKIYIFLVFRPKRLNDVVGWKIISIIEAVKLLFREKLKN